MPEEARWAGTQQNLVEATEFPVAPLADALRQGLAALEGSAAPGQVVLARRVLMRARIDAPAGRQRVASGGTAMKERNTSPSSVVRFDTSPLPVIVACSESVFVSPRV